MLEDRVEQEVRVDNLISLGEISSDISVAVREVLVLQLEAI